MEQGQRLAPGPGAQECVTWAEMVSTSKEYGSRATGGTRCSMELGKPLKSKKRAKQDRVGDGDFIYVRDAWSLRAYYATRSKGQFLIALRLYRRWRMQVDAEANGAVPAAVSRLIEGTGLHRHIVARTLRALVQAGLVIITESTRPGRAARYAIVDRA